MATDLTNVAIKDGFSNLLHLDGGLTSTEKLIYDGDGTVGVVKFGTTSASVTATPSSANHITNKTYVDTQISGLSSTYHPLGGSSTQNFIAQDLTVHGTTITKDSQQVNIGDAVIVLNAEETGTPSENAGFEIERGTSTNTNLLWDESTDRFKFTNDGSTYYNIPTTAEYDLTPSWVPSSDPSYLTAITGQSTANLSDVDGAGDTSGQILIYDEDGSSYAKQLLSGDVTMNKDGEVTIANDSHTHSAYSLTAHTHSGYATSSHTHSTSNLTDVDGAGTTSGQILIYDEDGSSYAAIVMSGDATIDKTGAVSVANNSHTHTEANITDLGSYITSAYSDLSTNSKIGTGSTQVAQGNHTHTSSDLSDVDGGASGEDILFYDESTWKPYSLAEAQISVYGHTHGTGDITNLSGTNTGDVCTTNHTSAGYMLNTAESSDLSDVDGGASGEDILFYDESTWKPCSLAEAGIEPSFTKNTAFNKDFGTSSTTVAYGNHTHSTYMSSTASSSDLSDVDGGASGEDILFYDESTWKPYSLAEAGIEPSFTKNTAFNKNFGTSSTTVAYGNHTHSTYMSSTASSSALTDITGAGDTSSQILIYDEDGSSYNPIVMSGDVSMDKTGAVSINLATAGLAYGTTSSTVCVGNDSRLSNARTPTSHTLDSHSNLDFSAMDDVSTDIDSASDGDYLIFNDASGKWTAGTPTSASYISSASFNTGTGVITGSGVGSAGFTVDIDGRYLTSISGQSIGSLSNASVGSVSGNILIWDEDSGGEFVVESMSGDATMDKSGVVTVANDSHTHSTYLPLTGFQSADSLGWSGGFGIRDIDGSNEYLRMYWDDGTHELRFYSFDGGGAYSDVSIALHHPTNGYTTFKGSDVTNWNTAYTHSQSSHAPSNANYITNNNQLINGAGYITAIGSHDHDFGGVNLSDVESGQSSMDILVYDEGKWTPSSLAEAGCSATGHTHSTYLPLIGGTVTGALTVQGSTTLGTGDDTLTINMNHSNPVIFNNTNNSDYGIIRFYNDGTHVCYFGPGGASQSFSSTTASYSANGFTWNIDTAGHMIIANRGSSRMIRLCTGNEGNDNFDTIRIENNAVNLRGATTISGGLTGGVVSSHTGGDRFLIKTTGAMSGGTLLEGWNNLVGIQSNHAAHSLVVSHNNSDHWMAGFHTDRYGIFINKKNTSYSSTHCLYIAEDDVVKHNFLFDGTYTTAGQINWSGGNSANANTAYTHSQASHFSTDADSEQTIGSRYRRWNSGAFYILSDPRHDEESYQTDLINLHMYATTSAGAAWGQMGLALYNNGTGYQYLHTRAGVANLHVNNNQILHAGNYTSYSTSWANVGSGARENYTLTFKAPSNGYAGFAFHNEGNTGAGYFLVRSSTGGSGVYSNSGITLVTDAGWLTLANRHGSSGVRLMTNGTTRLQIEADGSTAFNQSITTTGDVTAYYSDSRLKDFHGVIENPLDKVMKLNGYYFTENAKAKELGFENDRMQVGVSAQEIEEVLPELIKDAPIGHGYKTIDYGKITPLLIEAIKELKTEINQLKGINNG